MTITLAVGPVSVELPLDLRWANEFEWSPVEQTVQRTLTGAIVISTSARVAGRPIILAAFEPDTAWTPRPVLGQAREWASVPGQLMLLTMRGVVRTVVFDHAAGAIETTPIAHYNDADASDWFRVTYRFLETA